jgi:hypothetical protein
MTDWSGALGRAFQNHLDLSGSSGSSGSGRENSNVVRALAEQPPGTTPDGAVVPVVPPSRDPRDQNHWNHCQNQVVPDPLLQNSKVDQDLSGYGTTRTTGTTEFEVIRANENFDERAALVEHGADVPRDWAEGFARLAVAPSPAEFSTETWWAVVDDGARFLDDWGRRASQLGWSALDVFGVFIQAPRMRSEMAGLLPVIAVGRVVAINSSSATIRSPSGDEVVWLRRSHAGAGTAWELGSLQRSSDWRE